MNTTKGFEDVLVWVCAPALLREEEWGGHGKGKGVEVGGEVANGCEWAGSQEGGRGACGGESRHDVMKSAKSRPI